MEFIQIAILAIVQGAAELLPVSSSAHVIVAEKLMGLDPSSPEMTFLLVMLHTGTMFAVIFYFWSSWIARLKQGFDFLRLALIATAVTGVVGLGLKKVIEDVVLGRLLAVEHAEIEHLFKSLPLIAVALLIVGLLIFYSGLRAEKGDKPLSTRSSILIGLVQGLCLPFRGFSRSGATISTGMLLGLDRRLSEDFSFVLAVLVTPAVLLREFLRVRKAYAGQTEILVSKLQMGGLGMVLSFAAGWLALKFLSSQLEQGKWRFFGAYCVVASCCVAGLSFLGY